MHRPFEERNGRDEPDRRLTLVEADRRPLPEPIPEPERGSKAAVVASVLGLAAFAGLSALVRMGRLVGPDLAASRAADHLTLPLLGEWAEISGILASAELYVLYAVLAALLFWRRGVGWWSLTPLAFLIPMAIELAMKLFLRQPLVTPGPERVADYPPIVLWLDGSYPSGHAIRGAFLCIFGAVLLWRRGGLLARSVAALALPVVALAVGLARVYAGDHWLSDVIGGLLLGTAVALLVAPPVASRLFPQRPW